MTRPLVAAILTMVLVTTVACGGGPPPVTPRPELAPITDGDRLYTDNSDAITDSLRMVVRDQAALEEIWSRATRNQDPPPEPPAIDFQEHMVVVVAAGRMTPQDQIVVDSVGIQERRTATGDEEEVLVVFVNTILGCRQVDLDAYPIQMVRVPRFEGTVRFEEQSGRDPGCQSAAPPDRVPGSAPLAPRSSPLDGPSPPEGGPTGRPA